jgi:hypothetical protein
MKSYLVRGHGDILQNEFKLGNKQYVIFSQKCGDPALAMTTLNQHVKSFIKNTDMMSRYIRGNYNKRKIPPAFRDPIILGPRNTVRNMMLTLSNNRNWLNATFGVWNQNKQKRILHGVNTRLSNTLRSKNGVFFVDACRTHPNYSPSNNVAERILVGLPSGIPRTASNLKTHAYESFKTKRFKAKRKRPVSNITLGKNTSSSPPPKRRRTGESPVMRPLVKRRRL